MRGARAPKANDKADILATKYKLDGNLPFDLRSWSHAKMNNSSGGIPHDESKADSSFLGDEFVAEKAALGQVFKDSRINLQQKEVIARSVLQGNYDYIGPILDTSTTSNEKYSDISKVDEYGYPVKPVYDEDLMRGTAQVNRARMRPLNFLEAKGEQMDIVLVDQRVVMELEHIKNVARVRSPDKGKRQLFSWAGETIKEEVHPIKVELRAEADRRDMNGNMSISKNVMYSDAKKKELERTKDYLQWQRDAARRSKARERDRKAELQMRREAINKFRRSLQGQLTKTKHPMKATIMRYVDAEVAWNIMSAYRGHTMSMDMVVDLVGQTLGSLEEEDKKTAALNSLVGDGNGRSFITEVAPLEPLHIPSPSKQPNSGLIDESTLFDDNIDDSVVTRLTHEGASRGAQEEALNDPSNKEVEVRVEGIHKAEQFLKPYSAGLKSKRLAQENLFAPRGLEKKGPEELPHTAELAKYQLTVSQRPSTGSRVNTAGTNPGMSREVRREGSRGGARVPRASKSGEETREKEEELMKQHWNSEPMGDKRHPNDRIRVDSATGEITNVHAWHSEKNPGSRMNNPSADGLKGWNAGKITMRKAGSGYITKLNDEATSPEKAKVDEIFALDDTLRQRMTESSQISQSKYMENMQAFIDGSQTLGNNSGGPLGLTNSGGSVSASIDDSTVKETDEAALEEEWNKAKPLVDAIEHEKLSLGTLPRIQPEKVLSGEDLAKLGRNEISIDTIAAQLRWAKQKKQRQEEEARQKRLATEEMGQTGRTSALMVSNEVSQPENKERLMTSQSLGDLNAMISMDGPKGGIALQTNHFSNMDVELGFRQAPEPGSLEDMGIKSNTPKNLEPAATMNPMRSDSITLGAGMDLLQSQSQSQSGLEKSLYSMENPREIQRLLDQNLKAPPKQLKSTAQSLPESPFKSYEDKMKIINAGVSAGAGMGLWMSESERQARLARWGPRAKSRNGRYRVGQSSAPEGHSFSPTKEDISKRKGNFNQLLS